MASIKCKCGNTYFARVHVNQFKDFPASLHTPLHEEDPDNDMRIYQCIACSKYMLPPIHHMSTTEQDREVYHIIDQAIQGEIVEKKKLHRGRPIHPGTARFVENEKAD